MLSTDDLNYLSGLFDGEGSFSIQVQIKEKKSTGTMFPNFGPKMTMTLKYGWEEPLNLLKEAFGGTIYEYTDGMHRWSLSRTEGLIYAAEAMQPHLRIKREICANFLKALGMFPTQRLQHAAGERTWTEELAIEVTRIALTLNPIASRKSPKTLAYLEDISNIYKTSVDVDAVIV